MAIFFEIVEQGDQTIIRPIGKRAGIFGIVSFIALVAVWVAAFAYASSVPTNTGGVVAVGFFTLFVFSLPNVIGWIDHLPLWFFPSTKRPGRGSYLLDLQIYGYSLNGVSKSITKTEEQTLLQAYHGRQQFIFTILIWVVLAALAILFLESFRR